MKLNFHKSEKMPRRMKDHFAPSKEFAQKTKGRFLAAFEAHYPSARRAQAPRFAPVFKAMIGSVAGLAVLVGGLSAYADTKNVPADNALYPFKRIKESIQLALAPPAAKADLQSAFTVRRIDEINDLSSRKPTSTALTGLADDFDASINSSVNAAENDELSDGELDAFCGKLLSAIATSSVPIYENLLKHPRTLDRFENACKGGKKEGAEAGAAAGVMNGDGGNNGKDRGEGAGGELAPASTPASTLAESASGELQAGGLRDYLHSKLRSLRGSDEVDAGGDGEGNTPALPHPSDERGGRSSGD